MPKKVPKEKEGIREDRRDAREKRCQEKVPLEFTKQEEAKCTFMGRAFALLNAHMSESYLRDELQRCYDVKENNRGQHLR